MIQKIVKYLIISILILFGLLVGFSQTRYFKNMIKEKVTSILNQDVFQGTLYINSLEGTLFNSLVLKDVSLTVSDDTLLTASALVTLFNPIDLVQKDINIKLLKFEDASICIRQWPDQSWNFQHVIKESEDDKSDSTKMEWGLYFHKVNLSNVSLTFRPLNESEKGLMPQQINSLDTELSLSYSAAGLYVRMKKFNLRSVNPNQKIQDLNFILDLSNEKLNIKDINLLTPDSHLNGSISLDLSLNQLNTFSLEADSLKMSDVHNWSSGIPLKPGVTSKINATFQDERLIIKARLWQSNESIELSGYYTSASDSQFFDLMSTFDQVNIAEWIQTTTTHSRVNGQINASGQFFNIDSVDINARYKFDQTEASHFTIKNLTGSITWKNDSLKTRTQADSEYGDVLIEGHMVDQRKIILSTRVDSINMKKFTQSDQWRSDAVFNLDIAYNLVDKNGDVKIRAMPFHFGNISVDTLNSMAKISDQQINIEYVQLNSNLAHIYLQGQVDSFKVVDAQFRIKAIDLTNIQKIISADSIYASGTLAGKISGEFDSIYVSLESELNNLVWNTIMVDSMSGRGFFDTKKVYGHLDTHFMGFKLSSLELDKVGLKISGDPRFIHSTMEFRDKERFTGIVTWTIGLDSLTFIEIPKFEMVYNKKTWYNPDTLSVTIADNALDFSRFSIVSGQESLRVDGVLDFDGKENIDVVVNKFDLSFWSAFVNSTKKVNGFLDATIKLRGTATSPVLNSQVELTDMMYGPTKFGDIVGRFIYNNKNMDIEIEYKRDEQRLLFEGTLPIHLAVDIPDTLLYYHRPVSAKIHTDSLDIAYLDPLLPSVTNLKGVFKCDIQLSNTLDEIHPSGELSLENSEFVLPYYGVHYDDIQFDMVTTGYNFKIKTFKISSGDGSVQAAGSINLDATPRANLKIKADKFLLVDNPDFYIILSSSINAKGPFDNFESSGEITIDRSRIDLNAFGGNELQELDPILVESKPDSVTTQSTEVKLENYFENLLMKIHLNIPRNTWVKSPELNMEITGDLDLVKADENIELFGTLRTIRGTYDIFGRRFDVQEGQINFVGGEKINPQVNITALYIFRTLDREKRKLKLNITGEAFNPSIEFSLDGARIEEADAISYLIFGKSIDQLSHGQKSELSENQGLVSQSTVRNVLAGQLAGHLTEELQQSMNLDIIEFKGEQNWRRATVVIGKYITEDIFVSYERTINLGETSSVVPEEINLEYELTRYLFIRANKSSEKESGFDFIFKFEKE